MYKKVCRTCLLHLLLSWCSRCRRRRRIFRSRSSPEINCFFRNIRKWEKWLLSFFPINLSDLPKIAKLRWMNRVQIGCDSLPFIWMLFKTCRRNLKFGTDKLYSGCVPLRWSGSGSVIRDHSDHGRSNEPMNPLWTRIHLFRAWSTIFRVILNHSDRDHPKWTHPIRHKFIRLKRRFGLLPWQHLCFKISLKILTEFSRFTKNFCSLIKNLRKAYN